MIMNGEKRWWRLALTIDGTTLTRTWKRVLLTTVLAFLTTVMWEVFDIHSVTLTVTPFSLIGLAISIFLGFRNNASYDRYWEARKLWGRMVNVSRSWARQVSTLIQAPAGADETVRAEVEKIRETLILRQVAYVHGFRLHLRKEERWEQLGAWLDAEEMERLRTESNRPAAITQVSGELVADAWRKGFVHPMHVPILEGSLTEITGIQGGCERILATPVPFIYNVLMHRIVGLYCIFLPFGLVSSTHWFTPISVAFIAYAFYGLDSIGDEIEEPFGRDPNDLPLTFLSRMIEVNLRQRIGDEALPGMHRPVGGVLD
jgi:putative membrane protein